MPVDAGASNHAYTPPIRGEVTHDNQSAMGTRVPSIRRLHNTIFDCHVVLQHRPDVVLTQNGRWSSTSTGARGSLGARGSSRHHYAILDVGGVGAWVQPSASVRGVLARSGRRAGGERAGLSR